MPTMQSRSRQSLIPRLDAAAQRFDEHAFLHAVTRQGLLERLAPMTLEPKRVIDLGAATGGSIPALRQRFPKARLYAVDLSLAMLGRHRQGWIRRPLRICANADALPFPDDSVDAVFANLLLPYVDDPGTVFREVARVLRNDGIFAFASLGPDSFCELREAWRAVDDRVHVAEFPDMHDLGDGLVRAGLRDPVLDVDRLAVSYREPARLFEDLTFTGARNVFDERPRGLTGRRRIEAFTERLFGPDGRLDAELEIVYGHAFGGRPMEPRGPIAIDPASIGRRR
jgi:malonyl-CoA O-methyltransferase